MPIEKDIFYPFSGWRRVQIVTETEMAQSLGLERGELRTAIMAGLLSYHLHPTATEEEQYYFTLWIAEENKQIWACLEAHGWHDFKFHSYSAGEQNIRFYKCSRCSAQRYD